MGTEGVFLGKHEENVGRELGDCGQERVNWRWPERAPKSGAGWHTHRVTANTMPPTHPGPLSSLPPARCTYLGRRGEGVGCWGQHPPALLPREGPGPGSWRQPLPASSPRLRELRVQRARVEEP